MKIRPLFIQAGIEVCKAEYMEGEEMPSEEFVGFLQDQVEILKKRIAELEAENSYLKEVVNLCGVSEVNWKERTFRIKASPEKWFGVMGTRE